MNDEFHINGERHPSFRVKNNPSCKGTAGINKIHDRMLVSFGLVTRQPEVRNLHLCLGPELAGDRPEMQTAGSRLLIRG